MLSSGSGLCSKRVELNTVKTWIMETLPKTEELNGIAVAHPVLYGKAWVIAVAKTSNVRQRDVLVTVIFGIDTHIYTFYM